MSRYRMAIVFRGGVVNSLNRLEENVGLYLRNMDVRRG
jgi:hypothetical protein